MRGAALVIASLLLAGCGSATRTTTAPQKPKRAAPVPPALRVAVLGQVPIRVAGAGKSDVDAADLVVVARHVRGLRALAAAHPATHFVLVGRPYEDVPEPNIAGLLFRDDEAAYLAGIVAGLVTSDQGALDAAVAWVGGRRLELVDAFERGAQAVDPALLVLRAWSEPEAARCKETALDAISRGASVVFAGSGPCAEGVRAAAGDQNAVGLSLADFERPDVAVAQIVRDALRGRYYGGENIVFGADSGAVGIARLDPRMSADAATRAREAEQELAAGLRSPG